MGQSNMVGFGQVNDPSVKGTLEYITQVEQKYQHLLDDDGQFSTRLNVRNVFKNTIGNDQQSWLGVNGRLFGPELQVGHILGSVLELSLIHI